MSVIVVRYGEISLKSHSVRRRFTEKLMENIQNALLKAEIEGYLEEERGRIFVFTDNRKAVNIIKNVFGVVSVSWAKSTDSDMDRIAELAISIFRCRKGSFAVRATRTGNQPYTSQELAAFVGEKILENCGDLNVNLRKPDFELFIEVRNSRAFVFTEKVKGVGGMPLGTQGTIASYMRDGSDLISAWMLMKRGCNVLFPEKSEKDLKSCAERWGAVPTSGSMKDILKKESVLALCTGRIEECLKKSEVPVLCPTAGLSDEEMGKMLELIFS